MAPDGAKLEPIGAVSDPPGGDAGRNRGKKRPPEGKSEVRNETESGESQPEDFALHEVSLLKVLPPI